MFRVTRTVVEAHPCGAYCNVRAVAFGKSPKQAWAKLRRRGEHTVDGLHPSGHGGTPILQMRELKRGSKVLYTVWN
jgi:hypothetical protein